MSLDDEDFPSRRGVCAIRERLMSIEKCVLTTMIELQGEFIKMKNTSGKNRIYEEMHRLEHEMSSVQNRAQEYLDARARADDPNDPSSLSSVCSRTKKCIQIYGVYEYNSESDHTLSAHTNQSNQDSEMTTSGSMLDSARSHNNRETFGDKNSSQHLNISYHSSGFNEGVTKDSHNRRNIHSDTIGQDFWRLKRVTIPVFSGDKSKYYSWRAALLGCIDKAPASAEFKLLQLREYLKGEALATIEQLGQSTTAYEVAKQRLDRKYGGDRRR